MAKPAYIIFAKNRDTGESHKIGVLWESPYGFNLTPVTEPKEEFNERAMVDAIKCGDCWLNVTKLEDKGDEDF